MSLAALIAYALAHLVASAMPGPAMLTVISSGIGRGTRSALACALGIAVADVALVSVVLVGLTAIAQTFGWLFVALKYAGALYLVLLGYRMWRSAGKPVGDLPQAQARLSRQFLVGAAIAFGNPKALLFYASLMPLLLDIHRLRPLDYAVILAIALTNNLIAMGGYAVLSGAAARWFRSTRAARLMNRVAGSVMIGSGVLIATRA